MSRRKEPVLPLEELTSDRLAGEDWMAERKASWGSEHKDECQVYLLVTPSEAEALARGEVPDDVREQARQMAALAAGAPTYVP